MTENLWDEVAELQPHSRSILTPSLAGEFYQHPSLAGGARKRHGDREGKLGPKGGNLYGTDLIRVRGL